MQLIRFISRKFYDHRKRRFQSLAFKNSSGEGGISVLDKSCILEQKRSICSHLRQFYSRSTGDPPIFWEFSKKSLPQRNLNLVDTSESDNPDECHYNLMGLSDKQARQIFYGLDWRNCFKICHHDNTHQRLTDNDIGNLASEVST